MAAIRPEAGVPPSSDGGGWGGCRLGQILSQARVRQQTLRSVETVGGC